jgi:hypothetical protein
MPAHKENTMDKDLDVSIITEDGVRVGIDPYDDGVWLHLAMRSGTAYAVISRADAQRLMEGLRAILEAQPA